MDPKYQAQLLKMFNEVAPIARYLGMRLTFNEENSAVVELPYNPNLDHALGYVHGGIYATMMDSAGWFTSAATHDASHWAVTSSITVNFLLPAQKTTLRAVGKVLKGGKRQDVVEIRLYDGEEQLVGHATATFMVLPRPSPTGN